MVDSDGVTDRACRHSDACDRYLTPTELIDSRATQSARRCARSRAAPEFPGNLDRALEQNAEGMCEELASGCQCLRHNFDKLGRGVRAANRAMAFGFGNVLSAPRAGIDDVRRLVTTPSHLIQKGVASALIRWSAHVGDNEIKLAA